ncbi:MAG: alpha/beta hydrolase domain-containing protein, partial [Halioglobus sp.]
MRSATAIVAGLALACLLQGCSDGSDDPVVRLKLQAENPTLEGPIASGGAADCCILDFFGFEVDLRTQGYTPGTPFYAGVLFDEAEPGYRETEYFFSGTATSYIARDEPRSDGIWSIQAADTAPYNSRMVVLRPADDADFNGTV